MGIFSQTDVAVGTALSPLLEEQPNFVQEELIASVRTGVPLVQVQKNSLLNGITAQAKGLLNLAKSSYVYGLPEASTPVYIINQEETIAEVESILGVSIVPDISVLDYPIAEVFALDHLLTYRDYDPVTNVVGVYTNETVICTYQGARIVTRNGIDVLHIYLYFNSRNPSYRTLQTTIPIDTTLLHYQFTYYEDGDNPANTKVLIIPSNTLTYPYFNLDNRPITGDTSEYLPVYPIKQNDVYIQDYDTPEAAGANITEELYTGVRLALSRLTMNLEEFTDSIREAEDSDDLSDCFLMFAVDINSEDPVRIKYMFKFLELLDSQAGISKTKFLTRALGTVINQFDFQDDGTYNYSIYFNYSEKTTKTGSIGTVGTYTKEVELKPPLTYKKGRVSASRSASLITLRYQETTNTYVELTVSGLTSDTFVVRFDGKDYSSTKTLESVSVEDEDGLKDGGLYLPLNMTLVRENFSLKEQRALFTASLSLVYYAVVMRKRKWYELSIIRGILTIVIYAVAFKSGIASLTSLISSYGAVIGIVIFVLNAVVLKVAIDTVLDLLVDIFGEGILPYLAFAVVVLNVIYGDSGGVSGLPFADTLLELTLPILQGITRFYDEAYQDVLEETEALQEAYRDKQEELAEAEDLLNGNYDITLVQPPQVVPVFSENPTNFFFRTIHVGNPGVQTLSTISSYVENSLRLPTIEDSLNSRGL